MLTNKQSTPDQLAPVPFPERTEACFTALKLTVWQQTFTRKTTGKAASPRAFSRAPTRPLCRTKVSTIDNIRTRKKSKNRRPTVLTKNGRRTANRAAKATASTNKLVNKQSRKINKEINKKATSPHAFPRAPSRALHFAKVNKKATRRQRNCNKEAKKHTYKIEVRKKKLRKKKRGLAAAPPPLPF